MSIWAYQREVDGAAQDKAESAADPEGVRYMDQLWELVEDEADLTVVLRTDERRFDDIAVPVHWHHGRNVSLSESSREHSELVFAVPSEVARQIQQRHIGQMASRFFGLHESPVLGSAVGMDDSRIPIKDARHGDTRLAFTNNWEETKAAIQATAEDTGGYLGGQRVMIGGPLRNHLSPARVREGRLELLLEEPVIEEIKEVWAKAFRREVLLDTDLK